MGNGVLNRTQKNGELDRKGKRRTAWLGAENWAVHRYGELNRTGIRRTGLAKGRKTDKLAKTGNQKTGHGGKGTNELARTGHLRAGRNREPKFTTRETESWTIIKNGPGKKLSRSCVQRLENFQGPETVQGLENCPLSKD
jgi:hypothetical protein